MSQTKWIAKEKAMANDPDSWPIWPMLCVVRRDRMQPGVLLAGQGAKVYLWNRFGKAPESFADIPQLEYDSIDDMFADGWRVD